MSCLAKIRSSGRNFIHHCSNGSRCGKSASSANSSTGVKHSWRPCNIIRHPSHGPAFGRQSSVCTIRKILWKSRQWCAVLLHNKTTVINTAEVVTINDLDAAVLNRRVWGSVGTKMAFGSSKLQLLAHQLTAYSSTEIDLCRLIIHCPGYFLQ